LDNNFKVRDVARATSAAPTYFEVSRVKNLKGTPFPLIDGGVFANNPTLCAYSETRTLTNFKINKPTAKDMLIISIGTGGKKTSYAYKEAKDWGKLKWIQPVIDIMMSGNSETVHHHLKQIFDTLKPADKKDYYRLEPEVITASYEMDDASIENLRNLESDALNYIAKKNVAKQLNEIADKLLKY
jgi:patatin-like phospholipase/acyl hydrolase